MLFQHSYVDFGGSISVPLEYKESTLTLICLPKPLIRLLIPDIPDPASPSRLSQIDFLLLI